MSDGDAEDVQRLFDRAKPMQRRRAPAGWEGRVWSRIEGTGRPASRRWSPVGIAVAACAMVIVAVGARVLWPAPVLLEIQLRQEGGLVRSSSNAAQRGGGLPDRMSAAVGTTLSAEVPTSAQLWIYFGDTLVRRCPGAPGCARGGTLSTAVPLDATGEWHVLAIAGAEPATAADTFEATLFALDKAGRALASQTVDVR